MPIQKFRSIEDMSAEPKPNRGIPLERRIAELLAVSAALAPFAAKPKGVFKFRNLEEMQEQRLGWERERIAAGKRRIRSTSQR